MCHCEENFEYLFQFLPILFLTKIEIGTDSPCIETAYNILGMGDVIIPGFLIVHASIFGIIRSYSSTYSYAILSVLGERETKNESENSIENILI